MGYVVDITLILQVIFQVSHQYEVTEDEVNDIIYEFHYSDRKKRIHDAIRAFVGTQYPFAKEHVVDKIETLINENEV